MLAIILEYQKIKIFLEKAMFQIVLEKFLGLERLKNLFLEHMLLVKVTEKKLLERFTKTSYKKTNQKEFRVKGVMKKKMVNYMLNLKATMVFLMIGLIKKT